MADVDTQAGAAETRYKIGDVCRIADVQPYVLRYWESEFPALAADKSQPGPRTYSTRELKVIEQIKKLLYDEGYTIAGAKKRLESEALSHSRTEAKAADAKSVKVEPRVTELKPVEVKIEQKASETKPTEMKPAGLKPAEPKPDERLGVSPRRVTVDAPMPPAAKKDRVDTDKVTAPVPSAGPPVPTFTAPQAVAAAVRPPATPAPDPRVARAVAELKEILALLTPPAR